MLLLNQHTAKRQHWSTELFCSTSLTLIKVESDFLGCSWFLSSSQWELQLICSFFFFPLFMFPWCLLTCTCFLIWHGLGKCVCSKEALVYCGIFFSSPSPFCTPHGICGCPAVFCCLSLCCCIGWAVRLKPLGSFSSRFGKEGDLTVSLWCPSSLQGPGQSPGKTLVWKSEIMSWHWARHLPLWDSSRYQSNDSACIYWSRLCMSENCLCFCKNRLW